MSAWNDYGFPDPAFLSTWVPFEGLFKAVLERYIPLFVFYGQRDFSVVVLSEDQKLDSEMILNTELFKLFTPIGDPFATLDFYLSKICGYYLISPDNNTKWTFSKLLDETAIDGVSYAQDGGGLESRLTMYPRYYVPWACQRQRMVNRLRYFALESTAVGDIFSSSTHNGEPFSMADCIANAMDRGGVSQGSVIANFVEGIYGADHGWPLGSYCCNIHECANVNLFPELSDELRARIAELDNSFVSYSIAPAGNEPSNFHPMGFDVALGDYSIALDALSADSLLFKRELPYIPLPPANPVPGRFTYIGWELRNLRLVLDVSAWFSFKDDEEPRH